MPFHACDDKVRVAQQDPLGKDIGRGNPAQRHARRAGMRADKQLLKRGPLGGRLQAEALADIGAVLIVLSSAIVMVGERKAKVP